MQDFKDEFTPIKQLNMYLLEWKVKARVTKKQPIRTWSNNKGTGKLF